MAFGKHPLADYDRSHVFHRLNHCHIAVQPLPSLAAGSPHNTSRDIAIAERCLAFFERCENEARSGRDEELLPRGTVWETIGNAYHQELIVLLRSKDARGLAEYMSLGFQRGIHYGVEGGAAFGELQKSRDARDQLRLAIADQIVSCAEVLGASDFECPEQGESYGTSLGSGLAETVKAIEDAVGLNLAVPEIMGSFGLKVGTRLISYRTCEDIYAAHRLRQMGVRSVGEIGSGYGGLARQAVQLSIRKHYLFDLPPMAVFAAYFLLQACDVDEVHLYGEESGTKRINILPYWKFYDDAIQFELVFNRDSFPEIPAAHVRSYLSEIEKRRVPLLSINQESRALSGRPDVRQNVVRQMVAEHTKMRLISRHPYWLRRGYVEEFFA